MSQMGAKFPMRCRFDDGHGTFSNAIMLRKHYDAEHVTEYTPPAPSSRHPSTIPHSQTAAARKDSRLVTCDRCGVTMRYGSFSKHRRTRHAGQATFSEFGAAELVVPTSTVVADSHLSAEPEQGDPQHPWTTDEVVLPVIELMAQPGGVVPVAHLAALFAWRDATAVMLAAVSVNK
jgi:hypothetical protein